MSVSIKTHHQLRVVSIEKASSEVILDNLVILCFTEEFVCLNLVKYNKVRDVHIKKQV